METLGTTTRRNERPAETPDLIPGYFARIDKGNLLTRTEETAPLTGEPALRLVESGEDGSAPGTRR